MRPFPGARLLAAGSLAYNVDEHTPPAVLTYVLVVPLAPTSFFCPYLSFRPRSGYAQNGQLTETECDIMADLINLRIFSNVIYFTGRAYAGEDGLESLTSRAASYAKRVKWVNANRPALADTLKALMRAPASVAA